MVEGDRDGDEKIGQNGVNDVPDVVERDVSEAETPELELEAEEGDRLVPALVPVCAVGSGKSEVGETLESKGQRRERMPTECITWESTGPRDLQLLLQVALSTRTQEAKRVESLVGKRSTKTVEQRTD